MTNKTLFITTMKKLYFITLLFFTVNLSAQNGPAVTDLVKFIDADTSLVEKILFRKKFKKRDYSGGTTAKYHYSYDKKKKGSETYTETVVRRKEPGEIPEVEYICYLYEDMAKYKRQILKAGFKLTDSTVDRYKRNIYDYTKPLEELTEHYIRIYDDPENKSFALVVTIKLLELKAIEID